MLTAFGVSAFFLICYLIRVALSGIHRFPGEGFWRTAYLALLASHVTLAAVVPLLAIRAVQHGLRKRFDAHRAVVRFLFPIWMYVSVTGVIVYLMLYHWPH
jgi:putative membrane protein